MNIRLADKKDATQIANLHQREINQGFLRKLGENFLRQLYEAMIVLPSSFIMVAEENNQIIGFVSGCFNISSFYREFLKKYLFKVFFILLPKIFRLTVFKKIFEIIKYPKEVKKNLPSAELLTIAVLKNFHGQGVAQKLFEGFLSEMKNRNIKQFKVVVGESLSRAIRFYEKMGFKLHSSVSIHKNESSRIYIYTIE